MSLFRSTSNLGCMRSVAASGDIVVLSDGIAYKIMSYRRVMGQYLYSVRCMETRVITNDIPEIAIKTCNGLPVN